MLKSEAKATFPAAQHVCNALSLPSFADLLKILLIWSFFFDVCASAMGKWATYLFFLSVFDVICNLESLHRVFYLEN